MTIEKCIWREVPAIECKECSGHDQSCKTYLTPEEIQRREKEREYAYIIRGEK